MAGAGSGSSVPESCFENLPKLVDDLDVYLRAYQAYAEFSGLKVDIYRKWARGIFDEQVVKPLADAFPTDQTTLLRVLAVGSGDGKIDSCILEQLVARYSRIEYTVIEPAEEPMREFQALVQEREADFGKVDFVWCNETFDDYRRRQTADSQPGFHLVHAIHSLYYVDDLRQGVEFLQEKLVGSGVLCVILLSEEAGIYRVWDRYPKLVEGSPAHNLCSSHLITLYKESNIPYSFYRQSWPSDISLCFDPTSAKGNGMLDFISHVPNFRQSAPPALRDDLLAFLKNLNRSVKDDEGSSGGYPRDWDSIVMIKSK
ncbi:histamine N-methyltransferase-like [Diadema antillarum]|uniref:histamine N-methyltransferase-like n=1 Tax=Diadema antillarum TaxID=105358 RepID=UPI003A8A7C83